MTTEERSVASRRSMLAMAGVGAAAAGLGIYAALGITRLSSKRPDIPGLLWPNPKRLESFALVDQDGGGFGLDRLQGRWSLLFFGYTYCPDVCPLTLQALKTTTEKLVELGVETSDLQPVFVSVDPERDTPEKLKAYVGYFGDAFVGVTGEQGALSDFTSQLGVVYARGEDDGAGGYLVDHTATIVVVDPEIRVVGLLHAPHEPERMAVEFKGIRDFVSSRS